MKLPRFKFSNAWRVTTFAAWPAVIFVVLFKICTNCASEQSGIAYVPQFRTASMPQVVKRAENPEEFRHLLNAKWLETAIWAAGGLIIFGFARHQDRLDPMSPTFQGQKSLDDLGKWLDAENENRHRSLR
jgi:hypothetical protein